MTSRTRIADSSLGEYEDMITMLNRILREMTAIESDLDIDTRRYHHRRIGRILDAAAGAKEIAIGKMQAEKQAAANGRG